MSKAKRAILAPRRAKEMPKVKNVKEMGEADGKGSQQRKGRRGRVGVEYGKAESIDHAREEEKDLQKPRRRSGLKPEVTVKRKAKPGIIVAKGTKTEARPEITVKRDTVVKKAKSEAGDQKRGSMSMGDVRVDREGITIGYA